MDVLVTPTAAAPPARPARSSWAWAAPWRSTTRRSRPPPRRRVHDPRQPHEGTQEVRPARRPPPVPVLEAVNQTASRDLRKSEPKRSPDATRRASLVSGIALRGSYAATPTSGRRLAHGVMARSWSVSLIILPTGVTRRVAAGPADRAGCGTVAARRRASAGRASAEAGRTCAGGAARRSARRGGGRRGGVGLDVADVRGVAPPAVGDEDGVAERVVLPGAEVLVGEVDPAPVGRRCRRSSGGAGRTSARSRRAGAAAPAGRPLRGRRSSAGRSPCSRRGSARRAPTRA